MLFSSSSRFARITTTTAIMCSVISFAAAAQTAEQAPPGVEQAEQTAPLRRRLARAAGVFRISSLFGIWDLEFGRAST